MRVQTYRQILVIDGSWRARSVAESALYDERFLCSSFKSTKQYSYSARRCYYVENECDQRRPQNDRRIMR